MKTMRFLSPGAALLLLTVLPVPALSGPNGGSTEDGTPIPATFPQSQAELFQIKLRIGWEVDPSPPIWYDEIQGNDPTSNFYVSWRYQGPLFDEACLIIRNQSSQVVGSTELNANSTESDGFYWQALRLDELPIAPPLKLTVRVKDSNGNFLGSESNPVFINSPSPNYFLYMPFYMESLPATFGTPGVMGAYYCGNTQTQDEYVAGVRKFDGGAGPIMPGDKWHLGSCGKAMTATLYAILVQNGWTIPGTNTPISFTTPVAQFFPELSGQIDGRFQTTTVRDLACHRSGMTLAEVFSTSDPDDTPRAKRYEVAQILLADDHGNTPATGNMWNYDNNNYLLLGTIIEQITNQDYESLMQNALFNPLGMSSAAFGMPAENDVYQPHGHRRATAFPNEISLRNTAIPPHYNPAGGVYMTADDWLKFCRLHLSGSEGSISLTPASVAALQTPYSPPLNRVYAWGWDVRWDPETSSNVLFHNGDPGNFYSLMTVHPGWNYSVVCSTNLGPGPGVSGFGEPPVTALSSHLNGILVEKSSNNEITFKKVGSLSSYHVAFRQLFDQRLPEGDSATGFFNISSEEYFDGSLSELDAWWQALQSAARAPRVVSFEKNPDGSDNYILTVACQPGFFYFLDENTGLGADGWVPISERSASGDTIQFLIQRDATKTSQFFRARDLFEQ